MDFEAGALNISDWYAERNGGWQLNYGTTVSQEFARAVVMDGYPQERLRDITTAPTIDAMVPKAPAAPSVANPGSRGPKTIRTIRTVWMPTKVQAIAVEPCVDWPVSLIVFSLFVGSRREKLVDSAGCEDTRRAGQ